MSKTQIWLRDDERRLVIDCMEHLLHRLDDATENSSVHPVNRLARKYTRRSIREVLGHFITAADAKPVEALPAAKETAA